MNSEHQAGWQKSFLSMPFQSSAIVRLLEIKMNLLGRSVIVKRKGELSVDRPHFDGIVRDKTTL